jgi:hypothetical protein
LVHADVARQRFGPVVDLLAPALWRGDPEGDAAVRALRKDGWGAFDAVLAGRPGPEPVRALFDGVGDAVPSEDRPRLARAGRLFFRTGPIGGMVLGARSLVAGYCSPAGNKPLVRTGALQRDGDRRLAETGRFVAEVHGEGGLEPGGLGWQLCLRVRLMHAQVRLLLQERGDWEEDAWGHPLNQHDLVATSLLFSVVWLDGVRRFGFAIHPDEGEDHLHLWRRASRILGVEEGLLPRNVPHGRAMFEVIRTTQEPPDDDARALVKALLTPKEARVAPEGMPEGLCRALAEPEMADALHLPRTRWRHVPRLARAVVRPVEALRIRRPEVEQRLVAGGRSYWERVIALGLAGREASFAPTRRLDGAQAAR